MIYCLSDIHGNLNAFNSIMEQINLQPDDHLYVLGDVVDRHPYSMIILQKIMNMPNATMLLGNHELMMLRALGEKHIKDKNYKFSKKLEEELGLWYYNGGNVTNYTFAYLSKNEQKEIINYLKNLEINVDIEVNGKKYKLVHAAPIELYDQYGENSDSPIDYAVWDRYTIKEECPALPYCVIFGHTPTQYFINEKPMRVISFTDDEDNELWIGIDCGASAHPDEKIGRLACLRLDDMKIFYSK